MFTKRIVLNLDADLERALAERKAATGTPTQEFLRRSARMALYQEQQQNPAKNSEGKSER